MNNFNSCPIAGIDYPETPQQFDDRFATERDCIDYLLELRRPDGFICPVCNGHKAWHMKTGIFRCAVCRHKASVAAGTIFQGTRKPLGLWFQAIWYITGRKFGGSALGLRRVPGLDSYRTARSRLHKIRRATVRPGRSPLGGNVEVDETLIGGEEQGGKRGRGAGKKAVVSIALEVHDPEGFGRVRMKCVPDMSGNSPIPFICDSVQQNSTVIADCRKGCGSLRKHGYTHKQINISESGDPAHVHLPGVHGIASLLKRVLSSTRQGAVSPKHLDNYLDEYTFRFNRRTSRAGGLLFYRLSEQAVCISAVPYKKIIDDEY